MEAKTDVQIDRTSKFPHLKPPVIQGLLRQGETMNFIAPSKAKKSWLVASLALSIVSGRSWLDRFDVEQGEVLIVDNELHANTSADRIPKVAKAMGLLPSEFADRLHIDNLRGRLADIESMATYFTAINRDRFRLIVLDAWYRFTPRGCDENSNGDVTAMYNRVDRYAEQTGASFVLIHHASKGFQSEKAVIDVGSGAGAQSRAADTHLVIREHDEIDCAVVDAVVRSWAPIQPFGIRWTFPLWSLDDTLDPENLRRPKSRDRRKSDVGNGQPRPEKKVWTVEEFVKTFVGSEPVVRDEVLINANVEGLAGRKAESLLRVAINKRLAFVWPRIGTGPTRIATRPPDLVSDLTPETRP
jgi:AAA domain